MKIFNILERLILCNFKRVLYVLFETILLRELRNLTIFKQCHQIDKFAPSKLYIQMFCGRLLGNIKILNIHRGICMEYGSLRQCVILMLQPESVLFIHGVLKRLVLNSIQHTYYVYTYTST